MIDRTAVLAALGSIIVWVLMWWLLLGSAAAEEFGETPDDYWGNQWRDVPPTTWVAKWFHPSDHALAERIMLCESGGKWWIDNRGLNDDGSIDYGLFQHNDRYWASRVAAAGFPNWVNPLDPDVNAAVAAWLAYQGGGWRHWNASKGCWGG